MFFINFLKNLQKKIMLVIFFSEQIDFFYYYTIKNLKNLRRVKIITFFIYKSLKTSYSIFYN